eukprot:GDKJ01004853.1.p1 GENE.GDKJ01004853.1~~GDKJ01004853.1.p1  ORF type:complete len:420 (+),score=82.32 GDKJ01004853.1:28-1287(+)
MARAVSLTNKPRGECTFDDNDIVVFDLGSGLIKVGFSGEYKPRFVFESVIGEVREEQKDDKEDTANLKVSMEYGKCVLEAEGTNRCSKLRVPFVNGLINPDKGEDTLRLIIEHAFEKLHVNWEDTSVLLCDAPGTCLEQRQKVVAMLFEIFKVKAVAVMNSAVLSLFSTGMTRGLILEIGHESTWSVPVFEGFAIPHFSFSIPVGGRHITEALSSLVVADETLNAHFGATGGVPTRIWLDSLKANKCQVAPLSLEEALRIDSTTPEERAFQTPDDEVVEISSEIRFAPAEILFGGCNLAKSPVSAKAECRSIQDIIKKSLESVDSTLAAELASNIVLAGASSCFPGIAQRLKSELHKKMTSPVLASIININQDKDRIVSAWRGGSMLSSMSTFNNFLLGRKAYDESKTLKTNPIIRVAW